MDLRAYLSTNKISLPAFAELVGVSVQAIHRYVSGDRMPRLEVLEKIKEVTGNKVQPNDFLTARAATKASERQECQP